jgi:hypothetical protein
MYSLFLLRPPQGKDDFNRELNVAKQAAAANGKRVIAQEFGSNNHDGAARSANVSSYIRSHTCACVRSVVAWIVVWRSGELDVCLNCVSLSLLVDVRIDASPLFIGPCPPAAPTVLRW